jgi:YfiH family protein
VRCRWLDEHTQHLFTSLQLELRSPDSDAERSAWAAAVASVGGRPEHLVRVRQVHGRDVRIVRAEDLNASDVLQRPDADAIVSNAPGAVLAVVVADCVPILLVDPHGRVAGAIHAGWRGTCAAVARAAVRAITREFGTKAADLTAAIGPAIGPEDYEVGQSVRDAFVSAGHDPTTVNRWFRRDARGRLWLDLWLSNRDQLVDAGLSPERIATCGLSTLRHPGLFASYRRDGPVAGRMAALIVVPGERR